MRLIIEPGGDSNHRVIVKPGGLIIIVLGVVLALLIILSLTAGSLHPLNERPRVRLTKPAATSSSLGQPAKPVMPIRSARPAQPAQPAKSAKPVKPVKSGKSPKPAARITSPSAPTGERTDPVRDFVRRFDGGIQQAKSWFSGLLAGHLTPAQPAVAPSPAGHPGAHQKIASHAKGASSGHPSSHGARRGAAHSHRTH
jgi:hypothetical protein